MKKDSHVRIFLDSVEIPLKIGIYDHEKIKPQRVVVDAALFADAQSYLTDIDAGTIIDYARVYNAIRAWAERPQVQLIEDYLKELANICFEHESVIACQISIRKADVFGPEQGAGVELYTSRENWSALAKSV
ncbi:MAG: dihydroneopterin aldolase [Alphaproteobacteria bacterium]